MTGRPAARSAFALVSTARVADSAMADTRAEMRGWGEVMSPSWHPVTVACATVRRRGIRQRRLRQLAVVHSLTTHARMGCGVQRGEPATADGLTRSTLVRPSGRGQ